MKLFKCFTWKQFKKVKLRSPRLLKCLRRVGQNTYIALVGDSGVIQRCCEKERLTDGRWDFIFRNANSFTLFCSLLFITIHLLYRANSLLMKTLIMIWLLLWLLLCAIAFYCYRQCMMLTVSNVFFFSSTCRLEDKICWPGTIRKPWES